MVLVVLAVMMLVGLAGQGGLTRKSAFPPLAFGLPLIVIGAVLGYIGGLLVRPPG